MITVQMHVQAVSYACILLIFCMQNRIVLHNVYKAKKKNNTLTGKMFLNFVFYYFLTTNTTNIKSYSILNLHTHTHTCAFVFILFWFLVSYYNIECRCITLRSFFVLFAVFAKRKEEVLCFIWSNNRPIMFPPLQLHSMLFITVREDAFMIACVIYLFYVIFV